MSVITANLFSSYIQSELEERSGMMLTQQTLELLHNQRTRIAEQKLLLSLDPDKLQQYLQEEAYLRGQIDIITHIIELSNVTGKEAYEDAKQMASDEQPADLSISPSTAIFGNT